MKLEQSRNGNTWKGTAVIIIGMLIAYLVMPKIPSINWDANNYNRISATLTLGTLIALIWYTIETNRMQVAVTKQAELVTQQLEISLRPCLAVRKDEGKKVEIKNVGNGVAMNINFQPLLLNDEFDIRLEFGSMLFLEPGEIGILEINNFSGGTSTNFSFHANVDSRYANTQYTLQVTYENILQESYSQKFELGINGPKIGIIEKMSRLFNTGVQYMVKT